jgi:hypothetical protein
MHNIVWMRVSQESEEIKESLVLSERFDSRLVLSWLSAPHPRMACFSVAVDTEVGSFWPISLMVGRVGGMGLGGVFCWEVKYPDHDFPSQSVDAVTPCRLCGGRQTVRC